MGLIPVQQTNYVSSLAINESLTLEAQSLQALPNAIGANRSITLWGVHGDAEARMAKE